MKYILIFVGVLLLSGCYNSDAPSSWDATMTQRGVDLCKDYSGVYQWGVHGDFGKVRCYDNLIIFDVFTKKQVN